MYSIQKIVVQKHGFEIATDNSKKTIYVGVSDICKALNIHESTQRKYLNNNSGIFKPKKFDAKISRKMFINSKLISKWLGNVKMVKQTMIGINGLLTKNHFPTFLNKNYGQGKLASKTFISGTFITAPFPTPTVSLKPEPLRSTLNRLVRSFVWLNESKLTHQDVWNKAYMQFKYTYHIDTSRRAKNSNCSKLDIIEKTGNMDVFYAIIHNICLDKSGQLREVK